MKCNVAIKDLKIIYQTVRCKNVVCYVITHICTVDGKFTLREQANKETIERAWQFDKMEWKWLEFKSTATQPEKSAVNFETLFGEIKSKTYH